MEVGTEFTSGNWTLRSTALISRVAFVEVHAGLATSAAGQFDVAIKLVHRADAKTIVLEAEVMRKAREELCSAIPHLICEGFHPNGSRFAALQLKGQNLRTIQTALPEGVFSQQSMLRIAYKSLEAIKQLHSLGFIHGDIKPESVCIGRGEDNRNIYLLDFGLAKRFINEQTGRPEKSRGGTGYFSGTVPYASVRASKGFDTGRYDDLESWLYMLVVLSKGALPWNGCQLHVAREMKTELLNNGNLLNGCAGVLGLLVYKYIEPMDPHRFDKVPPYEEMKQALLDAMEGELDIPLDYEV